MLRNVHHGRKENAMEAFDISLLEAPLRMWGLDPWMSGLIVLAYITFPFQKDLDFKDRSTMELNSETARNSC